LQLSLDELATQEIIKKILRGIPVLKKMISKFFGSTSEKKIKQLELIVQTISKEYETIKEKSDGEIRLRLQNIRLEIVSKLKTQEECLLKLNHDYQKDRSDVAHDKIIKQEDILKKQTKSVLDEFLPEVFAIVKSTCQRLKNSSYAYVVVDEQVVWDMVPFDVQLLGAVALHNGEIAEMATGEGKTLVATLPLFLNALNHKGCHLITVNDYLALRDSQWMAPIFEYHNMSVGCLQNSMERFLKKEAYNCDIVYGTNSEFGFDYLRDNMVVQKDELMQKNLNYAIIDEVDSVLIDEARTPLIISGPVAESKNYFSEFRPTISRLFKLQNNLANDLIKKVQDLRDKGEKEDLGKTLLTIKRGAPKKKAFVKLMKSPDYRQALIDAENVAIRDKAMHLIDEKLYFIIDEKGHSAELCEMGQNEIAGGQTDLFIVQSFDEMLNQADEDKSLSTQERTEKKEKLSKKFIDKNEKLHNIEQLIKAYALFSKDEEYVLQDNKVMIVDEFTGRIMPGRRFSEGLHQAIEAKENVKIEKASQTFATVTIQNYFRLYNKIAGMTGTAVTEAQEFGEIYGLPVLEVPTNMPITRVDYDDMIYLTKNEKYQAVIDEIIYWHDKQKPVLVGTVSVDVSETLSRMLKRRKISHNVLNAKKNQKEAEIIKNAGVQGSVTIATNMAGRGTDIKLGQGVITKEKIFYQKGYNKKISSDLPYGAMMDGLHVIGTERHESRRIDRQLRGRAGRQGDPGTSRFYLSLEDNLMRLFGSDKIAPMMKRLGLKDGEAIYHPWMNKSVERAQKRVESHNFQIRKNLLEYDQINNSQREIIYKYRKKVLQGNSVEAEILEFIEDAVYNLTEERLDAQNSTFDELDLLIRNINKELNVNLSPKEYDLNSVSQKLVEDLLIIYKQKEELIGSQTLRDIEKFVLLETVDELYREHLHEMDSLKEGIGLRSYGQRDPLIEYKKESFLLFQSLLGNIAKTICQRVFIFRIRLKEDTLNKNTKLMNMEHSNTTAYENQNSDGQKPKGKPRLVSKKTGRNDPCPCGSGKKYKKCCGK